MAVGREIVNDFECDVAAKDNDGIKWHNGAKNRGDSGYVRGILAYRTVELMFIFAVSGNLSPVDAVAMTINPAEVAFGFEDKDSPLVDGETVNLEKFSVGDDVVFDAPRIGAGIGFGKITVYEDVLRVEDFFETKNEAGFGGGEFDGIR